MVCLSLLTLVSSIGLAQSDTSLDSLRQLLPNYTILSDSTSLISGEASAECVPVATKNRLEVIHYLDLQSSEDTNNLRHSFSRIGFSRQQFLFGVGIELGADLYFSGTQLDGQRSGASVRFSGADYRRQLLQERQPELSELTDELTVRLRASDPAQRLLDTLDRYESYRERLLDPTFAEAAVRVRKQADSLRLLGQDQLTREARELIAVDSLVSRFTHRYDTLLARVQNLTPQQLRELRAVGREGAAATRRAAEDSLIHRITEESLIQRLLVFTQHLEVGNTQLGNDGVLSIGLPIRGVSLQYGSEAYSTEVQIGQQLRSHRVTPQLGDAFHDRNAGITFMRGLVRRLGPAGAEYELGGIRAQDRRGAGRGFRRTNEVGHLSFVLPIRSGLHLTGGASYAGVRGATARVQEDFRRVGDPFGARIGVRFAQRRSLVELSLLRRGSQYQSFANPYLLRGIQGVRFAWKGSAFKGKLSARVQMELGSPLERENARRVRINGHGFVRYQVSPQSSFTALISPNIYRIAVREEDQTVESNILRAGYNFTNQRLQVDVSVTNLQSGFTWADSTEAGNDLVSTGMVNLRLSDEVHVAFAGQQQIGGWSTQARARYQYQLSVSRRSGRMHGRLGLLRLRQYAQRSGGWGINVNLGWRIGRSTNVELQLYYRQHFLPLRAEGDSGALAGYQRFSTGF